MESCYSTSTSTIKVLAPFLVAGIWTLHFLHKHQRDRQRDTYRSISIAQPLTTFHLTLPFNTISRPESPLSCIAPVLCANKALTDPDLLINTSTIALKSCWQHQNVLHEPTDAAEATAWRFHQYTRTESALPTLRLESTTTLQITFTASSSATASCPVAVTSCRSTTTAERSASSATSCTERLESS